MRTSVKLSFLPIVAAAMIAGSATSAAAHDRHDRDRHHGTDFNYTCGNTALLTPTLHPEDNENYTQESDVDVNCVFGNGNWVFNYDEGAVEADIEEDDDFPPGPPNVNVLPLSIL